MRATRKAVTTALAGLLLAATVAIAENTTYRNERFGTTASFPAEVFSEIQPPPENGDGRTWRSKDGASLAIFGSYNVLDETPTSLEADAKAKSELGYALSYSKAGKDWVVLSGKRNDRVFYERREFGTEDVIHSVVIEYPEALATTFDPLVGSIAGSLSGP